MSKLILKLILITTSFLPREASTESEAVTQILETGGTVVRDNRIPIGPAIQITFRFDDYAPRKLKLFPHVRKLRFECCGFGDEQLELIAALPNLEKVELFGTLVTDLGIAKLQQLRPSLAIDAGTRNTADKRIRSHFHLREPEELSNESIRQAILRDLPLGTSEEKLQSFLSNRGIGRDKLSECYPKQNGEIVCRIEYDPASGEIVHRHYCVVFKIDEKDLLADVVVKTWLTGP